MSSILIARPPTELAGFEIAALPSAGASSAAAAPITLGHAPVAVLEAVQVQDQPLTQRQIAIFTGLADWEVRRAVETLCDFRMVARLNTVIESYVSRRPPKSEAAAGGMHRQA